MICSISGEPAVEPVLSTKSNRIFERRLIVAYIDDNGTDPITQQPLTVDDLIPIDLTYSETPLIVRDSNQTSIPSLLSVFQNEWDALALELFELRKQLTDTKKELSLALYKQDAAIRVAARAIEEKEEAKKALQDLAIKIGRGEVLEMNEIPGTASTNDYDNEEPYSLHADYKSLLTNAQQELFKLHKSTKHKSPFAPASIIRSSNTISLPLFGNNLLSADFNNDSSLILIISSNESPKVYSFPSDLSLKDSVSNGTSVQLGIDLKETQKPSTSVWSQHNLVLIGCENGDLVIADCTTKTTTSSSLSKSRIVKLVTHPSLSMFIAIFDHHYCIYEFDESLNATKIAHSQEYPQTFVNGCLHNDGILLSLGCADTNEVVIIDILQSQVAMTVQPPPDQKISPSYVIEKIQFAPNGYALLILYGNISENTSCFVVYDVRKAVFQLIFSDTRYTKTCDIDKSSSIIRFGILLLGYEKKEKVWEPLENHLLCPNEHMLLQKITDDYSYIGINAHGKVLIEHLRQIQDIET